MVCEYAVRILDRVISKNLLLTTLAVCVALCVIVSAGDQALAQAAKIVDGKMQIDLGSDRAKASLAPAVDPSKLKIKGQVYLPLYSSVVVGGGATLVHMGANVTLRNVSSDTTITLTGMRYFDRNGELVSQLAPSPFTLKPMATVEIFIPITEASVGIKGGRGGSILADWGAEQAAPEPLMEALVLGSVGNGSYSFTVQSHGLTPVH
jgi:hypothetical protein